MVRLDGLKPFIALVDDYVVKTPCSKKARSLLLDCMVISSAFLDECMNHFVDEDEEQVLDRVLHSVGIKSGSTDPSGSDGTFSKEE